MSWIDYLNRMKFQKFISKWWWMWLGILNSWTLFILLFFSIIAPKGSWKLLLHIFFSFVENLVSLMTNQNFKYLRMQNSGVQANKKLSKLNFLWMSKEQRNMQLMIYLVPASNKKETVIFPIELPLQQTIIDFLCHLTIKF